MPPRPQITTEQWRDEFRPTGHGAGGDAMTGRYDNPLTPEGPAALPDAAVDTSDIPPLGPEFWNNARVVMPGEGKRKG